MLTHTKYRIGPRCSWDRGVKRNFWPSTVCQLCCFSEQRNEIWRLLFYVCCV